MKFESNQKHFTTDLVKKGENNEFWNMKISKPIIYLWCLPLGLSRTLKDFEEPLGVLTMYQVIPKTFTQANIPPSNQNFETFLAYKFKYWYNIIIWCCYIVLFQNHRASVHYNYNPQLLRAGVIEQQINFYKNKHNHNIRLDMIIAIAKNVTFVTEIKKIYTLYYYFL